jgi:hypothetical protein
MEADWEVEIGPDAPILEANWPGFVDLRFDLEFDPDPATRLLRARSLVETADLPGLAESLVKLNSRHSPVWTSKCDVWAPEAGEYRADEMDAAPEDAQSAWACYIDLLPGSGRPWTTPQMATQACQAICARLRAIALANCRADLIVRQAVTAPERIELGITAYLSACGKSSAAAKQVLTRALQALAHALAATSTIE